MAEILSNIAFQMSVLLFVALAGYLISSRINQSAIIGEIILGIIIGPSLLGLITYTDFVKGIAELGAIIMLFVVGLEFKVQDVFKLKYAAIALIGVIVPFIGPATARSPGFEPQADIQREQWCREQLAAQEGASPPEV